MSKGIEIALFLSFPSHLIYETGKHTDHTETREYTHTNTPVSVIICDYSFFL